MDAEKMQEMVNLIAEQKAAADRETSRCAEMEEWGYACFLSGRSNGLLEVLVLLELADVTPSAKS